MFTSINAVLKQLNAEGWNDITLEYINKGVMTDTYKMLSLIHIFSTVFV